MLPTVELKQAQADALNFLTKSLPQGYTVDYSGLSRQYVQESGFVSVPMSIAGALAFVSMGIGGASLNIYTEVGLVTLMGLISKHAILIVEFANDLQRSGASKREAVEQAAAIRLRPIIMTTASMVLGVIPLITASGAGAVSRFNMGLVIASGLSIGTIFTLFVVPAIYMLLAADHSIQAEPAPSAATSPT